MILWSLVFVYCIWFGCAFHLVKFASLLMSRKVLILFTIDFYPVQMIQEWKWGCGIEVIVNDLKLAYWWGLMCLFFFNRWIWIKCFGLSLVLWLWLRTLHSESKSQSMRELGVLFSSCCCFIVNKVSLFEELMWCTDELCHK